MTVRSSASTCGASPFWLKILILRNIAPRSSARSFGRAAISLSAPSGSFCANLMLAISPRALGTFLRKLDARSRDARARVVWIERQRLLRGAAGAVEILEPEKNGTLQD